MSDGIIGSVGVSVTPDARDFWRRFREQTEGDRPDVDVRVRADTSQYRAQMAEVSRSTDGATEHISLLKKALVGIAPAAVPLGGVLAGAFAGLIPVAATAALGIAGINKALKNGSLAGTQFGKDISSLKGEFDGLEGIAGGGLLQGLSKTLPSLQPLFKNLNQLVGTLSVQLGRIIGTAGPAMVHLFTALEPLFITFGNLVERGAKALEGFTAGSGISNFVRYVQKELPVVEKAFSGILKVVGALGSALAPVGDAVLKIVAKLGPVIAKLITQLSPVFAQIAKVGLRLVTALAPLFSQLGTFVRPLVTIFGAVARAVLPVVTALSRALRPVLPILARAFTQLFNALRPVLNVLSKALVQAIQAIAPSLPSLAASLGKIALAFVKILKAVAPLIPPLIQLLVRAVGPLTTGFRILATVITSVATVAARVFKGLIDFVLQAADDLLEATDAIAQHLPFVGHSMHVALQGAADSVVAFKKTFDSSFNDMNNNDTVTPYVNVGPALSNIAQVRYAIANINNPGYHSAPVAGSGTSSPPRAANDRPPPNGAGPVTVKPPAPIDTSPPPSGGGGSSGSSGGSGTVKTPKPKPPSKADLGRDFSQFVKSLNQTASQEIAAFRKFIGDEVKAGLSKGMAALLKDDNKKLVADIQQRDAIAGRLAKANAKLLAAQRALASEAKAIKAAITGSFDITTAGTGFDGSQQVTLGNIIAQQKQDLNKAKQFAAGLRKLAREGLNKPELRALAEAGPSALAQVLALEQATPKQIAAINATEEATAKTGAALGATVGQDLYGAQIKADRVLVGKFVTNENKVIDKISRLGDRMAKLADEVARRPVVLVADGRQVARIVQTGTRRNQRRTHATT